MVSVARNGGNDGVSILRSSGHAGKMSSSGSLPSSNRSCIVPCSARSIRNSLGHKWTQFTMIMNTWFDRQMANGIWSSGLQLGLHKSLNTEWLQFVVWPNLDDLKSLEIYFRKFHIKTWHIWLFFQNNVMANLKFSVLSSYFYSMRWVFMNI